MCQAIVCTVVGLQPGGPTEWKDGSQCECVKPEQLGYSQEGQLNRKMEASVSVSSQSSWVTARRANN